MMMSCHKNLLSAVAAASLCLAGILGVSSCKVHEWPNPSTPADLKLDFVFSTDLPPFMEVNYDPTKVSASPEDYDFRYQVKFYRQLPDGKFDTNEASEYNLTLTKDDVTSLDYSTVVSLPEGRWLIRCWADYVAQGSDEDIFYKTSSFKAIELSENHYGNSDFKDAFLGTAEVELVRLGSKEEPVSAVLEMERPLAKFQFIATDLDELVTKVMKSKMTSEEFSRYMEEKRKAEDLSKAPQKGSVTVASPAELPASSPQYAPWDPTKAPGFNPSDYYIRFYYTQFMPFMFNMFTNKPIDSRTGVYFDSEFVPLNTSEALMGFDYVLVNGHESSVYVSVGLFDYESEEPLSMTNPINVPIVRSKLTTVRGDFLTIGTGGGIGINPDFEDEFNIYF